jgi:2'-5' RNA ligase
VIRAFAAIPLPEALQERLAAVAQMLPLPRRLPPENLHLTLAFLGEVPEPIVEEAHYAFEAIVAPPFRIIPRGVGHFGGDRPRVVYAGFAPEPALDRLQAKVETAARRAGVPVDGRRFVPHVTLGRFRPGEADVMRLEHALLDLAGFAADPVEVTHFALYRSHLGHGGAHYEELARYPLTG